MTDARVATGHGWNNAALEAFFVSLKTDRIKTLIYKNRDLEQRTYAERSSR